MAKSKKQAPGKISAESLRKLINKSVGLNVAHNLKEDNPTKVIEWIPTGSRWLDSIICKGQIAGIPVGKVVEVAGLTQTGKSFMAAQIAANAQKMGITVVYMDSESAIDPSFLERIGCDLEDLIYVQVQSVEQVLETVENILSSGMERVLFIWDSLALSPTISDVEGDFNPQSTMAMKARILAKGMSKLTVPIANAKSTFLILNQLKTNISSLRSEVLTTPYVTPGGKAVIYAYSLRIWLTGRKAKASFVLDDNGFRIGSEVKVKLEKSRFGTAGRRCNFKILWGDDKIGIQDKESWLDAIRGCEEIDQSGAWFTLHYEDGTETKFQNASWLEKLEDDKFKNRIFELMDKHIIKKFDAREGSAADFYDTEDTE